MPEEMEMEPLSLPGWAAPTLAGLLRGPAGSAPRPTCTIATRTMLGTETLRMLQACSLQIRDLLCTIALLQMESGRATPTWTRTTEIRDLLRRLSVIRVPLSVIRVPLPEDQKEQEEEMEEEEEEETEEEGAIRDLC